ncbi:bifunctional folylpolyglutamate synthase/dihydrofolate synthase [Petrotoga olearia]|uniref:Dihydrofolate synthase/folylpolyglutamate synthase n=2 Tax=Petrotoga olearia TaxID=156203 RepID=A0A2K1NZR8_9BACT|nr:folylpolyglutamate synthase/dihydrofolate synthase family protein [Petrotoga olearia]KUK16279.1 MAG: FolC bifunctional protein [Petrotoga mobilis]PNR96021.1 folylpolyglutamate synthase [Petrotoga olearia DSM 13574]RMA71433.1 dihydrofolate synthase/folylpolyglutamate synthase [Petrotoga olearia]HBT50658.1 bifunctional folylpolyglutamate synthase/dihydrofolate synthase [Petrotoga sp.]
MEFTNLVDYLYQRGAANFKVKLGLERIEELTKRIGNPQNSFNSIHITGTNGKGSVTTALSQILRYNGLRVGTFISPHLVSLTERVKLNGENISEREFVDIYNEIEEEIRKMDLKGEDYAPSFFEITTAMAFKYFEKQKVDVGIIEVGLGGRLDATNILNSDISVITSISKDHIKTLGDTLETIAYEKAGIIKKNNFLVLGNIDESPKKVILDKAKEVKAEKIFEYGKDFHSNNYRYFINKNMLDYYSLNYEIKDLIFGANGTFQMENVTTSLAAVEAFMKKFGKVLSIEKVREAMANFYWEGRFEYTEINGKKIVFDGAHNFAAAQQLEKSINLYFPTQKKIALIGILDDKDYEKMSQIFSSVFDKIIVTSVPTERGRHPELIYEEFKKYTKNVEFIKDPSDGFNKLLSETSDVYFVTGSLYLVGKIKELISTNLVAL